MGLRPFEISGRGAAIVGLMLSVGCLGYSLGGRPIQIADTAMAQQASYSTATVEPSSTLELTGLQKQFESVAKQISPAVVAISSAINPVEASDAVSSEGLNGQRLNTILDRVTRTVGTGFVIDADGYILTNEHVISGSEQLWVTTDDKKVYPAIVVGSDPRADLAVLKIPARNLPVVRFADYNSVQRGQWTIALGNPYGLSTDGEMCMSVGVVSAINRSLPKLASKENRLYCNLIQTTAEINPGNSGGPLFDIHGEVIGINTAVILPQKQTNGIGFAMPITAEMMARVREMKEGGEVIYGYMGVVVSTPTLRECHKAGLESEMGARVDSIEANSPAAASSLKEHDIIVQVNGELIHDSDHFVRVTGSTSVLKPAQIGIYRDGKPMTLPVQLRKRQLPAVVVSRETQRFRWRGLVLGPIPANWNAGKEKAAQTGLMVFGIANTSPFVKQGIAQGTIITSIGGRPVASLIELQKVLNDNLPEKCEVQLAGSAGAAVVSITP